MDNKPVVITHFGRPHSGKTFAMEKFANSAKRETIFVYNAGRKEDWQGYVSIKLDIDEKGKTLLFEYKGKLHDFKSSFMRLFRGKKVRARRGRHRKIRDLLFLEMTEEGYEGTFFIIDDAVGIIGSRLTFEMNSLFFGSKHVDIWLGVVFHMPSQFPVGAWGALTFARFFVNNVAPCFSSADKIPHSKKMIAAYEKLQVAPQYSYCTLEMNTGKMTYTPYKKPRKKRTSTTNSKTKKK
ncbi:hypothetical protein [Aureispira sp. CCB-E]|uniref:hypothetical protein n=1 Tax=Aureispira sp. CCB-E TaxID=3051121 RepID=UPI0028687F34|nr:hypothetical protein [Aureispira sp. CCB-E]WMX12411.1 hypothetical protein QP953_16400 [Aureispira sp. CCB-E]